MPTIISHRGLGFGYKENSLEAIKAACNSIVDAVEFDVRIHNNELILSHNKFKGTKPTYLKGILPHTKNKLLLVDVKEPGLEKELLKILKGKNFIIISWYPNILKKIHKLNPKIKLSYSYNPKTTKLPNLKLHSVNIPWYQATNKLITQLRNKEIKVNVFTINKKVIYNKFKNKADGIFTNRPKSFL
jgi:glycerophosphoryl diester phosphodiesterase